MRRKESITAAAVQDFSLSVSPVSGDNGVLMTLKPDADAKTAASTQKTRRAALPSHNCNQLTFNALLLLWGLSSFT